MEKNSSICWDGREVSKILLGDISEGKGLREEELADAVRSGENCICGG